MPFGSKEARKREALLQQAAQRAAAEAAKQREIENQSEATRTLQNGKVITRRIIGR